MSYSPTYRSGDHKAICDVCGGIFKGSQLHNRWDGLMVCGKCFESRHPQDFVRAKADTQAPQWTRPETQDSFVAIPNSLTNTGVLINSIPLNTGLIG